MASKRGLMASLREAQQANLQKKQELEQQTAKAVEPALVATITEEEYIQEIRKRSTSGLGVFDFTSSLSWICGGDMNFTRLRFEIPNLKAPLFQLQEKIRELQAGLEIEQSTFKALQDGLLEFEREEAKQPKVIKAMYDDFYRSFARVIGKAMVETADPFGFADLKSLVQFNAEPRYGKAISETTIGLVHGCLAALGYCDIVGIYVTVNECITRLAALGFLATYHYSLLVRTYYMNLFRAVAARAFQLANDPVCINAGAILCASVQADEKKQSLVLSKCLSPDAPTPRNVDINVWMQNLEAYHIQICLLRFDCISRSKYGMDRLKAHIEERQNLDDTSNDATESLQE